MTDASFYPPIEDYGIIGDMHTAALVSSRGSVDWLCVPAFDSPALFCRLLDWEKGGFWQVSPVGKYRVRRRYLEDTNILETVFTCDAGRVRMLDCLVVIPELRGTGHRVMVRLLEGIEGAPEMESTCRPTPNYALAGVSARIDGCRLTWDRCSLDSPFEWSAGEGIFRSRGRVRKGESRAFVLACMGEESQHLRLPEPSAMLRATEEFWRRWAGACTYDGPYREQVVRSALALKLLIYEPTGAIVAAPTTSLPEEIGGERNWDYRFAWIRDASLTLYALLMAGYKDEDDAFFGWITRTVQIEHEGMRVLYPITPEGDTTERVLEHLQGYRGSRPVRVGNAASDQLQLDMYGEVLDALYFAVHAGDYDPRGVWDHFVPIVDWVAEHWPEPGNGIWEVRGGRRHFVYSKAMCWVALDRAIKLCEELGLRGDLERWRREREAIRSQVLQRGWSERLGAFKQSYEDERLDASNLLLSSMGFIAGDDPRMVSTIDATLDQLVVDGLCYRYLDAPEGVSGNEGAFVLCTFWLINALALAGRHDEAREMFERMLRRASPLGLYAEEIDPSTGHHLGNYPQAFSHIGVTASAVTLARGRGFSSDQRHRSSTPMAR